MAEKKYTVRILMAGGILTPGVFMKVTEVARLSGNKEIGFGSRQDVLFTVLPEYKLKTEERLNDSDIQFEWLGDDSLKTQNIVSSFVANEAFASTSWVNASAYLFILEGFKYSPKIKVNIIDPAQKLVPHFSGHLNFLASEIENYWFLYVRREGLGLYEWPELIYSEDIAALSQYIEDIISLNSDYDNASVYSCATEELNINTIGKSVKIRRSQSFHPYYEGIHRMASGKDYWAGFYWRNNRYSLEFIENVCRLCLQTGIGRISLTPWKTFMVKGIKEKDRLVWEQMIGRFGINMRHSSFEYYWHIPYLDKSALSLKRFIVREFEKVDIRTFGLTFSIGRSDIPFSSVIIGEKKWPKILNFLSFLKTYKVSYAKDFVDSAIEYNKYHVEVSRKELPNVLMDLSKRYYDSLPLMNEKTDNIVPNKKETIEIHQCPDCLTAYISEIGDEENGIEIGTSFSDLPTKYCCNTCGQSKNMFVEKSVERAMVLG